MLIGSFRGTKSEKGKLKESPREAKPLLKNYSPSLIKGRGIKGVGSLINIEGVGHLIRTKRVRLPSFLYRKDHILS